jgi:hypothetical protein
MKHLLKENLSLVATRILSSPGFCHVFVSDKVGNYCYISNKTKEVNYFFPPYLYSDEREEDLFAKNAPQAKWLPNFRPEFLQAVNKSLDRGASNLPRSCGWLALRKWLYGPIWRPFSLAISITSYTSIL